MISNIQHQQFDSIVMDQILPTSAATIVTDKYVNNNSNNMNRNIHLMMPSDLLQNPDILIYDPNTIDINSSLDTKETITVAASQPLYENAPIIHAVATPTTTIMKKPSAVTTTILTINNNSNQNLRGSHFNSEIQLPVKIEPIETMIDDVNVQNAKRSHECALLTAKCDRSASGQRENGESPIVNGYYRSQDEQENHTNTIRQIEDVHNYSKANRSDDSTNSSSPEDDEEEGDTYEDAEEEDDDDVFTSESRYVPVENLFRNYAANNKCDSNRSAIKQSPMKKQSQVLQINQNNHHKKNSNHFDESLVSRTALSSSKFVASMPTAIGKATSPLKIQTSLPRATMMAICADVPDDNEPSEQVGGLNGDKTAPDHHARRPMNAFLIFCKRHRAIVRDKYKNLENRLITKILGEWWATLSNIEKACYTDLANQYKDAFFKANPNFKWYKLPAPPLRTCTIRPGQHSPTSPTASQPVNFFLNGGNSNNFHNMSGTNDMINGIDRFNCDNVYVRRSSNSFNNSDNISSDNSNNRNSNNVNSNSSHHQKKLTNSSAVGVFKLADEAQMGSLSSLLCSGSGCGGGGVGSASSTGTSSSNSPNINGGSISGDNANNTDANNDNNSATKRIDHRNDALQNALSETSDFLSFAMPSPASESEPFQHMRSHADQILNGKRKSSDDGVNIDIVNKKPYSPTENTEYKKASRSCKGKRYQELMISGQIVSSGKKGNVKIRTATATSGTTLLNGYFKTFEHHHPPEDVEPNYSSHEQFMPRPIKITKSEFIIPDHHQSDHHNSHDESHMQPDSPNSQKQFDASDFDLEEKIKALPAQCLESYLTRKRETKKKKKIGSKRRTMSSSIASKQSQQFQQLKSLPLQLQCQSPPKTIQEARERIQNAMVGSQKRKARKESITRRDVNAINSSPINLLPPSANSLFEAVSLIQLGGESAGGAGGASIKVEYDEDHNRGGNQLVDGMMTIIKEEKAEIAEEATSSVNNTSTSDLLILAEVAANHIAD